MGYALAWRQLWCCAFGELAAVGSALQRCPSAAAVGADGGGKYVEPFPLAEQHLLLLLLLKVR